MPDLTGRKCVPCSGDAAPFTAEQVEKYMSEIQGWSAVEDHHIHKTYKFRDFRSALDFVNRIGEIAEREGHHPDLSLSWGRVEVTLFTHKINGLHQNDFIMAAKIDEAFGKL